MNRSQEQGRPVRSSRLVPRAMDPPNFETQLVDLGEKTTASELFYVRSHFPVPTRSSLPDWRLSIEGDVEDPFELTYEELARMPKRRFSAVLECAGNGRVHFAKAEEGELRWGDGAVGNARWSGVPVRALLRMAKVKQGAVDVVFEGADTGEKKDGHAPSIFTRGLPIEKAMDADTIVALKMNGAMLAPDHGFPARLIVPNWYAMASVKWLRRITVISKRFEGYYNRTKYVYVGRPGRDDAEPLTSMRVKSLIVTPADGQTVGRGTLEIAGVAWSGHGAIKRVSLRIGEESVDAELMPRAGKYGWFPWRATCSVKTRGSIRISAVATDDKKNVQPSAPMENRYQYGYNAPHKVEVTIS